MTGIKPVSVFFMLTLLLFKAGNVAAQVITNFSPVSGPVGTSVSLYGSGFSASISGNTVYFGAAKAPVTSASTSALTVSVPPGATYQPITVINTIDHVQSTSRQPFDVTFSPIKTTVTPADFDPKVNFTTGSNPLALTICDIDGDGRPDVITSNGDKTISILSSTAVNNVISSSSFGAKYDLATGDNPLSIATGDIDGDGKPDIVVVNSNTTVSVYRNLSTNGNISFAPKVDIVINNPTSLKSVIINDLDGDGLPDLAFCSGGDVNVLRNNSTIGNISFAAQKNFAANTSATSYITAGDVDGDGKPELLVTNRGNKTFSLFHNTSTQGNIQFDNRLDYSNITDAGYTAESIAVADLDGDGKPEILTTYTDNVNTANTSFVLVTRYNGPSLTAASLLYDSKFNSDHSFGQIRIADVNGDGKPDIFTLDPNNGRITIQANISIPGSITFLNAVNVNSGTGTSAFEIGDLDGDGKPEIVVTGSPKSVSVFKNDPVLTAPTITSFTPSTTSTATTVTIIGTNFTGATGVSFGNTPASSFVIVSATTINAVVTTGTTGKVRVTTPSGTAARDGFKFIAPPKIDYTTPNSYIINKTIPQLTPTNSGGAIPATTYGETSVIAGSGTVGSNDGTGTAAQFTIPYGIATDLEGNIYITEVANGRLRKITPGGVVTTVAPDAVSGTKYGTGPTQKFGSLNGVVIDADGNVYVADNLNALIRKITPDGTVTTLAGNSNITSQDGQGTAAGIYRPGGMVMDKAGNIYFTDTHNKIREVSPTGYVSTFVGSGAAATVDGQYQTASFNVPIDLVMDAAGNMYVAEQTGSCIRKITPNGVVITLAGSGQYGHVDGTGTAAQFTFLNGITIDASGNLYVTDDAYIRKITPDGKVTTVAGGGPHGAVTGVGSAVFFGSPKGITIGPDGNLNVVEQDGNRIKEVIATGYTIDKTLPAGLTFDVKTGIISGTPTVLSPPTDYTITGYNKDGSSIKVVSIEVKDEAVIPPPPPPPHISYVTPQVYPVKTPISPLVPTNTGGAVPENVYGEVSTITDKQNSGGFNGPYGIVADASGNLYISDAAQIKKITPAGVITPFAGSSTDGFANGQGNAAQFNGPAGMAIDKSGNLYVADQVNNLIRKITPGGLVSTYAGATGPDGAYQGSVDGNLTTAGFANPFGLVFDSHGNLFVSDYNGQVIRKIDKNGMVTMFAGLVYTQGTVDGMGSAAQFNDPSFMTIDANDNLYVSDYNGNCVRKITPGGLVTTFAGSNLAGFTNGAGTAATFQNPFGITSDVSGNIYVVDNNNRAIRKITPDGVVSTVAGGGLPGSDDGVGSGATFNIPYGITYYSGNLYLTDGGNDLIRKIGITGYEINKPLPPGLNFDAKTGTISGTPLESSPAADYTVTAYNAGGSYSTVVNIKVNDYVIPPPALPIITYPTPQSYTLDNTPISTLLPTSSGGPITNGSFNSVITLAGNGTRGSLNGTGNTASFNSPKGLTVDNSGNIYIADTDNSLIRKISPTGLVTTLAGSGTAAFANGTGTAASFNDPFDVAVDAFGNVYVADLNNHRIRKITPAGVVTTVAGNNTTGSTDGAGTAASFNQPAGIAVDNAGNLYVADLTGNLVRKITPAGDVTTLSGSGAVGHGDDIGNHASFNGPIGIAVDANGYVFVADSYNNIIRKITPSGIVTTFAGSGAIGDADGTGTAATFHDPIGLKIDPYGNLYVTDAQNNQIRKITPAGVVTTVTGKKLPGATDGDLAAAMFNTSFGIAIDADGNLYIGDTNNNLVRKITVDKFTIDKPLPPGLIFDKNTGSISGTPTALSPPTTYTVTAHNAAGSGSTALSIEVDADQQLPVPPKFVYETPQNYTVGKTIVNLKPKQLGGDVPANAYGEVSTFAGSGSIGSTDGTGTGASFHSPAALAMDKQGNIYVSDFSNFRIRKITPAGLVTTFAGSGIKGYVDGVGTGASFNFIAGLAFDDQGNLYVADTDNNLIRKIFPDGTVTTLAGSANAGSNDSSDGTASFFGPAGIQFGNDGYLYVSDEGGNLVRKVSLRGEVTTIAGNGGTVSNDGIGRGASFDRPVALAIDKDGNLIVSDNGLDGKSAIRQITPSGSVTTIAGQAPNHVAAGGLTTDAFGNIYFTDVGLQEVRMLKPDGTIETIAGNGATGAANGLWSEATFNDPIGIISDGNGNLVVADFDNNLIRKVALTGYKIDKPLPPGLVFDPKTGTISGTPSSTSPATDYTITGYNLGGSASFKVNIKVSDNVGPLPLPPAITYTTPLVYTVGVTSAILKPKNTGGAVPATPYGHSLVFAGSGARGKTDATGTAASFYQATSVATDIAGNIFVADRDNFLIRKITPAGVVTTFAGSGTAGSTDGQGTAASFSGPSGIATDAAGNIYVADTYGNRIRKITPAGLVSTIAGGGTQGDNNGPVAGATFTQPQGIAVDASGNIYIAEYGTCLIRKIGIDGMVSTLAGSGSPGIGDGQGTAASFNNPQKLSIDAAGNIYVADFDNNSVRKITPSGFVTTVNNNSGIQVRSPGGVAVDAIGDIFIADAANARVAKIDAAGNVTILADGIGNGVNIFEFPLGISLDAAGNLYVANFGNNNIIKVYTTGYTIDKALPPGLIFDPTTGFISGKPTAISPKTDYTVTAYNTGGSSQFTLSIEVDATGIVFGPIPDKTVCDMGVDFDPGATDDLPITYTSSDLTVATIAAGKIHITGVGTTTITAKDGATPDKTQTLKVTPALTPSIIISMTTADQCIGSAITFEATPQNGGTNPIYKWLVNGQDAGEAGPSFITSTLTAGDKVSCMLTSSEVCTTSATATSGELTFTPEQPAIPSVSITSSATGPFCGGTEVTFTATPSAAAVTPDYQWQVNGINAGTNSATFSSTTLADGYIVTCILTSKAKCLVNPSATSNPIPITLSPVSQCTIVIPNTFTPNGDGINDLWNISAITSYPNSSITVYTRYGSLVYRSTGYAKAWDGTYNGSTLPVGTYYYLIDLKNGKKPLSGPITIIR
ncbi:VCBS repeat-containing protein [Mucilaginibacter sp. BJC16-A38]|uniref:FG-GAP-like repeat-containing protein n=1 Tax=Mucilaginibacter phenanthrenivorans TaxID=1234842 RepID=UPI0021580D1B|nr:FG-GAP-like repeat-containing protein [Mucilaginibacter phenanthrenivorans]MCR8561679.1 VCBS repeat-containing protein [Mucilaginibacter phenanthrenivorans]